MSVGGVKIQDVTKQIDRLENGKKNFEITFLAWYTMATETSMGHLKHCSYLIYPQITTY